MRTLSISGNANKPFSTLDSFASVLHELVSGSVSALSIHLEKLPPAGHQGSGSAWETAAPVGCCATCGLQIVEGWSVCPDCRSNLTEPRAIRDLGAGP